MDRANLGNFSSTTDPISLLEAAKALKAIRDVTDHGFYQSTAKKLAAEYNLSKDDLERVVGGLSAEDDFMLTCRLMNTCRHITRLEQRPVIGERPETPDFLVQFHATEADESRTSSFFVDVKDTKETKVKMGGGALSRLRQYADDFGFPLMFAVRFRNASGVPRWALVEDADRNKTSVSIKYEDVILGQRYRLWNEYVVFMPSTVCVKAVFNKVNKDCNGNHDEYGGLEKCIVIVDGREFECRDSEQAFKLYTLCLGLSDIINVMSQGDKTVQELRGDNNMQMITDFLFLFNNSFVTEPGKKGVISDPSRVLSRIDVDKHEWMFDRKRLDTLVESLVKKGVIKVQYIRGTRLAQI